jgi:hypothetical protein
MQTNSADKMSPACKNLYATLAKGGGVILKAKENIIPCPANTAAIPTFSH